MCAFVQFYSQKYFLCASVIYNLHMQFCVGSLFLRCIFFCCVFSLIESLMWKKKPEYLTLYNKIMKVTIPQRETKWPFCNPLREYLISSLSLSFSGSFSNTSPSCLSLFSSIVLSSCCETALLPNPRDAGLLLVSLRAEFRMKKMLSMQTAANCISRSLCQQKSGSRECNLWFP